LNLSSPWWLPFGGVPEITPHRLHRWLQEGRPVQLIDSRTSLEFEQGTIQDAKPAPVTDLPGALDRLAIDAQHPVIFLCLSGHRSRPGTRLLRRRGLQAYSLKGGILAWRRAGYPLNKPNPD
jgi:rhodanese-related sulfurtransferase